jgi:hypothetical protein
MTAEANPLLGPLPSPRFRSAFSPLDRPPMTQRKAIFVASPTTWHACLLNASNPSTVNLRTKPDKPSRFIGSRIIILCFQFDVPSSFLGQFNPILRKNRSIDKKQINARSGVFIPGLCSQRPRCLEPRRPVHPVATTYVSDNDNL